MKNEYIELVKKWQAGEVEALQANAEAAAAVFPAHAVSDATRKVKGIILLTFTNFWRGRAENIIAR